MAYVPDRRDIIWINFDPQASREQARHRPALVLSPKNYNGKTSLCVLCPMTSQVKGYPFEVRLPGREASVVLSDQVKSLDWKVRKARKKGRVNDDVLREVTQKLAVLTLQS